MWYEIKDGNELEDFMYKMCYFHDSCIKEIKYLSGAYVNNELSMHPLNDRRILNVVIQRQYEDVSMIEMEFSGLKFLKLFPVDDKYTCEIMESMMLIKNGYIYWCECGELSEGDLDNYTGTMICASKLRWRPIDKHMGKEEFYRSIL